jgi:ubiquinone/menaquinone biosynthesis C-methylase UbiE
MTERASWDAAARTRASDRWADAAVRWNKAMTDALLSSAAITSDCAVLDLAAGSGDPALTIAARLSTGKVIALDCSHTGLSLASTHAHRLGLETKIDFIQADAHAMPLAQNSVDRVTCRCGVMFFNDTGLVMSEVLRVLRSSGCATFLVWGPFEQPFFEATVATVLRFVPGAQMPPQAQAMFRFASPGSLERVVRAAGFPDQILGTVNDFSWILQTSEELWAYQQEISTLCHPLFESIPADLRTKVDTKVISLLSRFQSGNVLSVPANIIVVAGRRS